MMSTETESPGAAAARTTFFPSVLKSFHSMALYDEVRSSWKGRGFLYLFMLVALASVFHAAAVSRGYDRFVSDSLPAILEPMPVILVESGEARFEAIDKGIEPITLNYEGKPMAIFDTTGKVVSLENADTEAMILVTKTNLQVRGLGGGITEAPLSDFGKMTISRETVIKSAEGMKSALPFFAWPLVLGLNFFYRMFQLLAYAFISRVWIMRAAPSVTMDAVMRLTAVSLTPAVIVEAFFVGLGINMPLIGIFYQLIAVGYVYQTLKNAIAHVQGTMPKPEQPA